MSQKATYLTLRFGGATAPVALFATSGKPKEAQHEVKRFEAATTPDTPAAVEHEVPLPPADFVMDVGGETVIADVKTDADRPEPIPPEAGERQADAYRAAMDVEGVGPVGSWETGFTGTIPEGATSDLVLPPSDAPHVGLLSGGFSAPAPVGEEWPEDLPLETRQETTGHHTKSRAEYVPPKTVNQQGVTRPDGQWVDLTERFAEIDERTKVTDADGRPVMEVVATIASSAIGRERIHGAKYVGGADPKTYKVLRLLWLGLRSKDAAAVVRWTEKTAQRLGIIVARGSAVASSSPAMLVLLECEWAENMRDAPPRVIGPQTVGVSVREAQAASEMVAALHKPPAALNDLRDERLAHRAELLTMAREGRLVEYDAPPEPAPVAETQDVAEALLAGVR